MPDFSIGTDPRPWRQRRDEARQRRIHTIKEAARNARKASNVNRPLNPLQAIFLKTNFFIPEPFSYIPDAPYEIRCILNQLPTLVQKQTIRESLISYKEAATIQKEIETFNTTWFLLAKRRWALRRLMNRWLWSKMKGRALNVEDPCTLSIPRRSIYVFDVTKRGYYIFDATSLKNHLNSCIGYNVWGFPKPTPLKNPFTNERFSFSQHMELMKQLREANTTSWLIEAHYEHCFKPESFKIFFAIPLKVYALEDRVRNPTSEVASDLIYEFIEEYFEEYTRMNEPDSLRYLGYIHWALSDQPTHPYIHAWITLYKQYEMLQILKETGHTNTTAETRIIECMKDLSRNKEKLHSVYLSWNDYIVKKCIKT